jgi:hypothetical protein
MDASKSICGDGGKNSRAVKHSGIGLIPSVPALRLSTPDQLFFRRRSHFGKALSDKHRAA